VLKRPPAKGGGAHRPTKQKCKQLLPGRVISLGENQADDDLNSA
jgi:hypothetical protein